MYKRQVYYKGIKDLFRTLKKVDRLGAPKFHYYKDNTIKVTSSLIENYKLDGCLLYTSWAVDNDNSENLDLALFKMYYGDKHLKTLEEVLSDLNNMIEFLYDEKSLSLLKDDLKEIYKAKTILGLLYPYEELKIGFSDKIEIVYIFGNQSNENNNLKNILIGIKNSKQYEEISKIADIKIAKSSFMGYGLYEKNMMNLDYAINML